MTGVFPGWRIFLFLYEFVNTPGIITPGLTDPVEISAGILKQETE
jgi:hypothetical protein